MGSSYRKGKRFELYIARRLREETGVRWARVPLSGGWRYRKKELGLGDLMVHPSDVENLWLNQEFYIECRDRRRVRCRDLMKFVVGRESVVGDYVQEVKLKAGRKVPVLFLKVERVVYVIMKLVSLVEIYDLEDGLSVIKELIEVLREEREKGGDLR